MSSRERRPIKLSTFCERVGVDEREVRYALARGIVPGGIPVSPGRGHHRQFDVKQAFWLAIVLRLKAAGLHTLLAGEVASSAYDYLRGVAHGLGWDFQFSPLDGEFSSEYEWILEIGDGEFVRICTNANPSLGGKSVTTDWVRLDTRRNDSQMVPIVIVQVHLTRLANLLVE